MPHSSSSVRGHVGSTDTSVGPLCQCRGGPRVHKIGARERAPNASHPTGFQPSVPVRYAAGVAEAACSTVICGRFALTVAPRPVLPYSKKRPSVQRFGDMSAHGWVVLIAAGSSVFRIVT